MKDIDALASSLLEESKRFLEKAQELKDGAAKYAFLHAALALGFSSLEAHINSIADDQLQRSDLSIHERAFLGERKVEIKHGEFVLQDSLQMQRVDDRIALLWTRCSSDKELIIRLLFGPSLEKELSFGMHSRIQRRLQS